MTPSFPPAVRWAAISVGVVGYSLLAHWSATPGAVAECPWLGVAVSLAPPAMLLAWLTARLAGPLGLALLAAGGGWILLASWGGLERHFGWVYFLQHLATYIGLAGLFGTTLGHGRTPLCTQVAEVVRGSLPEEVVRYTRQLTLAWTLFFAAMGLASTTLFLLASLNAWSIFANFLSLPLVLLMFVVEHRVRARHLPHLEPTSIWQSVVAFWSARNNGQGASLRCR